MKAGPDLEISRIAAGNLLTVRNKNYKEKGEQGNYQLFHGEVIKLSMSRIKVKKNSYFYSLKP